MRMQDALSFLPPSFKMNPTWNKANYKFNFSDVNFFDDFNISDVYKGDDFNISDMNVDDDFNISDIDYALFLGCDFNKEQILNHAERSVLKSVLETSHIISILYGPILWCISWLGIVFNIIIIFPDLIMTFSTASIFTSSISLILIMQALLLLCRKDLFQGNV